MSENFTLEDASHDLTWEEVCAESDGVRRDAWVAALEAEDGNVSSAAKRVGVKKWTGFRLLDRWGLRDWARELRVAAGAPPVGRPPGSWW